MFCILLVPGKRKKGNTNIVPGSGVATFVKKTRFFFVNLFGNHQVIHAVCFPTRRHIYIYFYVYTLYFFFIFKMFRYRWQSDIKRNKSRLFSHSIYIYIQVNVMNHTCLFCLC